MTKEILGYRVRLHGFVARLKDGRTLLTREEAKSICKQSQPVQARCYRVVRKVRGL
jgi:hypothetical protein